MERQERAIPRLFANLRRRLSPPGGGDEEQAVFGRLVGALCLVVLAALVIPAILSWMVGHGYAVRAMCLEWLCAALAFWLARRGWLQSAATLLFMSLLACALDILLVSDLGFHDIATTLMFPALLALASILHKWRFFAWFAVVEVLAVTAAGVAEMRGLTGATAAMRAHTSFTVLCDIDVILIVTAVAGGLVVQHLRRSLSESRRNAAALRESEQRHRTVIESLGEGVAITDDRERFLVANPAAEQIFGVPPGGLAGRSLNGFVPPPEIPRLKSEAARRLRGEKTSYELQIVRPDGAPRTLLVTVAPQYGQDGHSIRCVGVFRDVTAARQLEERIRLLAHALASTSDCVCITDFEDHFLYANEAYCHAMGYPESELHGRPIGLVRASRNDPEVLAQILPGILTESWHGEIWARSKDGREFPMALTTAPVRDGHARTIARISVGRDITARRRAEEALKESEARHREFVENAPIGIYRTTPAGRIVMVNPALVRMLGFDSAEELMRRDLESSTYEPDYDRACFKRLLEEQGEIRGREERWTRRDGSSLHICESAKLVRGPDGEIQYYDGVVEDITERKLTEEALKESEARFRDLVENTSDVIWETDEQGHYVYCSPAVEEILGFRQEQMIGRQTLNLSAPGEQAVQEPVVKDLLAHPHPFRGLEFRHLHADGSVRVLEANGVPIYDVSGRFTGYRGVTRDVTERRRAEEALRQSEARFRDLVENTSDLIWESDAEGRFVYCSPAFSAVLGHDPKQLLGKTSSESSAPEDRASEQALGRSLIEDPRAFRGLESVRRHADGTARVLETNATPILDAAGRCTGYRGITRDITERKRTEEELRAAKTSAEAADRAKSEFLATISHEIRTPMNGIIGMTDLLLGTGLSAEQRGYGEALKFSSEALLALLNDVLDFSRIEAGKVELESIPFDLRACLEEAEDLLAISAHAKHLELALLYSRDVPRRLLGDPSRIRQMVLNLVSNAIKFTERGSVWIEVASLPSSPGRAALRITVFDTGIGIAPDKLGQVFRKFTQADSSTRRRYGGTGLGLAIVKRLVGRMNGSIEVASQPGEGSAFSLVLNLPLVPGSEPEPPPPAQLAGTRVLIVNDCAINRFVFIDLCTRWLMRPDEAGGGAEALRMVAAAVRSGDPYRVIVLDSNMPEMDGEDVARRLRATFDAPGPAIVMATSSAQIGEAERFRAAGCDGYLVKPIKSALLEEALARVLGARAAGIPQPLLTDGSLVKLRNGLAVEPAGDSKPFAGCLALLAEDNLINQKLGVRLLERLGCRVNVAVNGLEAARLSALNAYDVVFMDCQMPEMDGFEATAEIRRREGSGRRTPIVAMTAYAMAGDRERCLRAGMDDYIAKPIRPGALEQALYNWFSRPGHTVAVEASPPGDELQTLA